MSHVDNTNTAQATTVVVALTWVQGNIHDSTSRHALKSISAACSIFQLKHDVMVTRATPATAKLRSVQVQEEFQSLNKGMLISSQARLTIENDLLVFARCVKASFIF